LLRSPARPQQGAFIRSMSSRADYYHRAHVHWWWLIPGAGLGLPGSPGDRGDCFEIRKGLLHGVPQQLRLRPQKGGAR